MSVSKGNEEPPRGSFAFWLTLLLEVAAIAGGTAAAVWRPSAGWVERSFSNGYYPHWERALHAITREVPFSLGDFVVLAGVLAIVLRSIAQIRQAHRTRSLRSIARLALDLAAVAGFYAAWFYAGWGWAYDRPPLQDRTAYRASRVTPAAIGALRARAIAEVNRLAPLAHARHESDPHLDRTRLREAWLPVVRRLGDAWTPAVGRPKPTLADPFMNATGTSGFINPFTLESQLASDLLWFERPFSLAHEWSHAAGFNREDEANYIAAVTCLRDPGAVARYSGWLELFLYLPPEKSYAKSTFVPLVWRDFAALRARNARRINLSLSRFSWHVYNRYLQSNHVASGIANYDEVTRLFVGIPLDRRGLPVTSR